MCQKQPKTCGRNEKQYQLENCGFDHNKFQQIPKIIDKLKESNDVALVSDAGTPGISDPAYRLIRAAIEEKIQVISIPGASALLAALIPSGLPTDRFIFEGFLPQKKGRKKY